MIKSFVKIYEKFINFAVFPIGNNKIQIKKLLFAINFFFNSKTLNDLKIVYV